jgi:hypothetical protein
VNFSKRLQGLFIVICLICLSLAFAVPPNTRSFADSPGAWTATGSFATARSGHTATILGGGKILAAGGQDLYGNALSDCSIYDPSTGVWSAAGSLVKGRFSHTATLLTNGKVLVAGGTDGFVALADCEIFDPATGVWTEAASLFSARSNHTATVLAGGRVFVAGGAEGANALSDCEIYDPATGYWTEAASLATGRLNHTATLLAGGQVLVAGGMDPGPGGLSSCEIYDPATGYWTEAASLATGRFNHTATVLADGKVLAAGGRDFYGNAVSDCEIYDPATGYWTEAASLATGRFNHTATLLAGGKVLAAGGQDLYGISLSGCEIYDPSSGVWAEAASLATARFSYTATLLNSGQVLAAGGRSTYGTGNRTALSSCEIWSLPSVSPNLAAQSVTGIIGAPVRVTATAGNAQATVSFSPPGSNAGGAVAGYTVTSNPGGITAQGTGSPITVTGLTNGTVYTFTVAASNAAGTGPSSAPSNQVTPAAAPGVPTGVSASAGNAQATVSFTPPASNGGSAITGYTVTSKPGGVSAQATGSRITVAGLVNGTAYTFTVTATNAAGTGTPSAPSNKVTPSATVRVSVAAGAADTTFTASASSSDQSVANSGSWLYQRPITLTNTGSALTNYQINIALTSSNMTFANAKSDGSDVRIKASDGVTDIPYWIELWNSTNQVGSIWVNVPSIPSGTSTIYLVYGNPSASTTSSGANTFLFFDDFETADPTTQPGYYQESTPAVSNMGSAQAWEGTDWPHFFTVLTMNAAIDGTTYKYWAWYGLHSNSVSGIGLAGSNDLVNWTKYSANPVIPTATGARCPSVINDSGTFRMVYETTTAPYQIGYATSTNGITWTIQSAITNSTNYSSCPQLWTNPNDSKTPYYLYYSVANTSTEQSWISVRHASTAAGLGSASDTIVWKNYQGDEPVTAYLPQIYAPNITYDSASGNYILRFESQPALSGASNLDTNWDMTTLISSSPTSGFVKGGGNPYHSGGYACPSNILAGSTLYNYYCYYTGSAWQIVYTTATPSSGLQQYSKPRSSLWTAANDASDAQVPTWNIVPCTDWKGASGNCLKGYGRFSGYDNVNMLESSYSDTNYIVNARIQQIEYENALLAFRMQGADEAYAGEIDYQYNGGNNLDVTVMPSWTKVSTTAAGNMSYNTWYHLEITVHGTSMSVNFNDGSYATGGTAGTYSSGAVGPSLDLQTTTLWDNIFVRQYAATVPTESVGAETSAVPGAPTNVTATAGNAQATVSFSPPASSGMSAITSYTVTSSPGGITGQGSASPITVAGLTGGTAYTFTVTATNTEGTGPASAASNQVTPYTIPGAPTNAAATAGNAQATVSFTAPASNGGSAITGYTVTSSPGGITGQGSGSPITVTGLTNGTAYTFTVTATNAAGTGPASAASNQVTPYTIPGAPTGAAATAGNAQATVAFTAPASNGGSAITSYTVTSNPGGITDQGSGSPITVTGLTNGIAYTFTVTATNAAGTGPASSPSNQVTPIGAPGAPTNVTATPGNTQATVSFTAPASNGGSAITGYTVTSSPGGITGKGSASPITATGLTNGTAYTFTVTATNSVGIGPASSASNQVTPATVPGAPTGVVASAGNALATVGFAAPASNGGSAITGYTVTSSPGGITGQGSASPITVGGLTNGTAYTFTVTATNSAGTGSASSPSSQVTPSAGDGWWSYQRPITITNSGSALTNYQINIALTASNMTFANAKSDGSDVRILANDGVTNIPFWIEQWNSTTQVGSIWVNVPSIPSGTSTIYLAYGNSSATSASSGANTFLFFDDFETADPTTQPGYYQESSPAVVNTGLAQAWEGTDWPFFFTVLTMNGAIDGTTYKYWAWYGLHSSSTSGVGLAGSNDLVNWTKYSGNPVIPTSTGARAPSVINDSGTLRMVYETTAVPYQIGYATSTNGITWTIQSALTNSTNYSSSPQLWINPNDSTTPYYLYYSVFNGSEQSWISVRHASTAAGLASASDTILWKNYQAYEPVTAYLPQIYAPNVTYDSSSGKYVLRFESQPALTGMGNTNWDITTLVSSSPTSGFTKAGGNPYHSGGYACPSNFLAGSTLYNYYCYYTGSAWEIVYTTSTPSSGLQAYSKPRSSLWTAVNDASDAQAPAWNILPCTDWKGASGNCLKGFGRFSGYNNVNMLQSSYSGTDYIVNARIQEIEYIDALLGFRMGSADDEYAGEIDFNNNGGDNLDISNMPKWSTVSTAAAGNMSYNTWYHLEMTVHGTSMSANFNNGSYTTSGTAGTYSSGATGPSLDIQATTLWDNIFVRQYAATVPTNSVGLQTQLATIPGAPTNITATAGNAQATVSFTAPASNGGSAITGYTVTSSPGGITGQGSASPVTVTGLTNGTAYTFTITANNSAGTGPPSSASNQVTPATVPGAPTGAAATAGNAQATVSFTPPASNGGSAITGYTVTSSPGGITGQGSASPITVTGLTNGTAYTFTVTATNSAGTGPASSPSNQVTPLAVPGAPTNVTATAGNAQATVSFTAPASNGGSATTSYTVTSSPGGITGQGSASPIAVTGLTNGTAYTFTVTATNSVGTGPASTPSNQVTPIGAPGAPTNAAATAGNAQATVSFTAPVSNGGSAITSYTVTSNPGGITGQGSGSPITVTGLSNGTAYTFTVTANNSAGTGPPSSASNQVTPATVPGAPTGAAATAGNAQATVSFTPPASNGGSAITGYTVTSSPGGITGQGSVSPIAVTGLTNGTAYTFTVTATNSVGTGPASSPSNQVTPATVPGAPTGAAATAGNAQATVSFTAPASNGGSAITSYTVTSSPGGITGQGSGSPIAVTSLTNGTAYTFTVTATNSVGTGPASTPSNQVTPIGAPGAPTNAAATAGNAQATVSFTPPASNGGSAITGYTVTSSPGGITGQGSGSPITVAGLTNGTAYTFTVTATNAAWIGPASSPSNQVTPATVPGAPTNATATAGNAQATVSFTAPASNGGSAITSYTVTSSPGSITGQGSGSPITVTGLTNGTVYTFTVTATNAVGTGTASSPSSQVTPATIPGAPTGVAATAGNAQATVGFTAPASNGGSAISGYTVTSSPGGVTGQGSGSPIAVTGLTNGTAYTFTVTATNSVGTGPASSPSNQATPATVPGAPTGVAATAGNAQATVSFTVPASNGGSAITGYTVTSSPGGITGQGSASPITVTGLTNGTAYTFTVTATNTAGTGPASAPSNSVAPATVPGAPTGVAATAGNAQATVGFTPPSSNGGSAITSYTVTSSPGGITGQGSASPITVTGLSNGTTYTFTVTATNTAGTGPASSPSNQVTPATVPGTPTNVTATAGSAQATVSFTAPASNGGSAISGYTVTSSPGGITGQGSGSPITVTGLTNGTAYTFTVTATNSVGTGPASSPSNQVTPAAVPGAPTNATATAGNAQATVSFTAPSSNGGSVITGYTVTSSPGGITGQGSASPITVTGLTNGTAYTFTVTATNAVGTGPASAPSNSVTPAAPQWLFQRAVTITNTGSALTNYQVNIALTSANMTFANAKSDGSDVRILASDGVTNIPYWIEQWNSTNQVASIWANVPSIPSGTSTIYLVYGNASATTISSGANTFLFFDDFETADPVTQPGYYLESAPSTVNMGSAQTWEGTDWPHFLTVLTMNAAIDGTTYKYWAWYGLHSNSTSGIGLAGSNDLVNWTKYSGNPVIPTSTGARAPSVINDSGTLRMAYETTHAPYQIGYATSTNGITWTIQSALTNSTNYSSGPQLWINPNDSTTPYYLYYSVFNGAAQSWISVRHASTVAGLASASDTILWKNYQAYEPDAAYLPQIYSPNILYDSASGNYILRFESQPALAGASNLDTNWDVTTLISSNPTSGFTKAGGNPYHSGGYACPSYFLAGSTLYNYYCNFTGSAWQIVYTTATPSSGLQQYSKPRSSLWTAVNDASDAQAPAWNIVPCTDWKGASGNCLKGFGRFSGYNNVNMLESSYSGTNYIVNARIQQIEYVDALLGFRMGSADDEYAGEIDFNNNGGDDLDISNIPKWSTISTIAAGNMSYNTWYHLEITVQGTSMSANFNDGSHTTNGTAGTYSSGAVGPSLDIQTTTLYDNIFVRQYAATVPANSVGSETHN